VDLRDLNRERAQAVGHAIRRCTAAMGGIDRKGDDVLFSGVFVKWRRRPFIVTASHCMAELATLESLRVLSENVTEADRRPEFKAARGYKDIEGRDVAFIELSEEEAAKHDPDWVEPSQLEGAGLDERDILCLRGYSSEHARPEEGPTLTIRRDDVVFATEVLPVRGDAPRTEYTDVRVQFDPRLCFDVRTGVRTRAPDPRGMSGCGAFALGEMRDGEIWSPEDIRLVGIQSSHVSGVQEALVIKPVALVRELLNHFYPVGS
jgi:hypothetical protein